VGSTAGREVVRRPGSATRRRTIVGRVERFVLGIAMGIAAYVIERRVLKAIKSSGEEPASADAGSLNDVLNEGISLSE
jgi:hypothetical protein